MILILFFIVGVFFLLLTYTSWFSFDQDTQADVTEEVNMIEIDVSEVSTTIIPDSRSNVSAELKGKGHVTVQKNGDRIKIQYKSKNWFNGLSLFKKKGLTIYIPEDYDQNIAIKSGSGNLNFSGKSKKEPMKLEDLSLNMSSGHVELSHLSTNHFEHDGSSGHVEINSLATKTGSLKMSSGNMKVQKYSGELEAALSSGRLILQMEKLTDSIEVDVKSGYATIDLPSNADFTLNGEVNSGDISTNFPLTNSLEEKHKIEGVHGSGKHKLDLNVSSGKIEVK